MEQLIRKVRRISVIVDLLGCDRSTVRRMIDDGRLEGMWIGRRRYVYLDSVKKYQQYNDFGADGIDGLGSH